MLEFSSSDILIRRDVEPKLGEPECVSSSPPVLLLSWLQQLERLPSIFTKSLPPQPSRRKLCGFEQARLPSSKGRCSRTIARRQVGQHISNQDDFTRKAAQRAVLVPTLWGRDTRNMHVGIVSCQHVMKDVSDNMSARKAGCACSAIPRELVSACAASFSKRQASYADSVVTPLFHTESQGNKRG